MKKDDVTKENQSILRKKPNKLQKYKQKTYHSKRNQTTQKSNHINKRFYLQMCKPFFSFWNKSGKRCCLCVVCCRFFFPFLKMLTNILEYIYAHCCACVAVAWPKNCHGNIVDSKFDRTFDNSLSTIDIRMSKVL